MTLTRKTRSIAAAAAVAVATGVGGFAMAGSASAYTPCPVDICPPIVVDTTHLKIKWPNPPCLSCPKPYLTIEDLYIKEELGRQLEGVALDRELGAIAEMPGVRVGG